jgi:hypothetical protein
MTHTHDTACTDRHTRENQAQETRQRCLEAAGALSRRALVRHSSDEHTRVGATQARHGSSIYLGRGYVTLSSNQSDELTTHRAPPPLISHTPSPQHSNGSDHTNRHTPCHSDTQCWPSMMVPMPTHPPTPLRMRPLQPVGVIEVGSASNPLLTYTHTHSHTHTHVRKRVQ